MRLQRAIYRIFGQKPIRVTAAPIAGYGGISSRICAGGAGVMHYHVEFSGGRRISFVGKCKSMRIIARGIRMVSGTNIPLMLSLVLHHKIFGYNGSASREAILYSKPDLLPRKLIPEIYGAFYRRGFCLLAMEELPRSMTRANAVCQVLDAIAGVHAKYLGRPEIVGALGINHYTPSDYRRTKHILLHMFRGQDTENRQIFGEEQIMAIERFLHRIDTQYASLAYRQTLTHNDCCARNLCVMPQRICLYDWELACYQNPEHDAVELIISVLDDLSDAQAAALLHHYRQKMTDLTGIHLGDAEYLSLLQFNALEYCVNKLMLLRLAGNTLHLDSPLQTAINTARMLGLLGIGGKTNHGRT